MGVMKQLFLKQEQAPLYNVSAGAYGNPFVPGNFHVFESQTWVQPWAKW